MAESFAQVVLMLLLGLVAVAVLGLAGAMVNGMVDFVTGKDVRDWWRQWRTPKAPGSDLDRAIAEVAAEIEKRAAVIVRETACDRLTALHRAQKEYRQEMAEVATATGGSCA